MTRTLSLFFLLLPLLVLCQTKDNEVCRELYDSEKFEEAYSCYSQDDQEIFSVYMSAYLAKFLDKKKEYKFWYKKLYSADFNSSETYYYAANLHPNNSKDYLKILNKGLKRFPNDTLLLTEKVNYFIVIKEYEAGIPIIEQLIPVMTDDLHLYITAGNIYNWVQKDQKAIPYFEKALELDSDNFEANYGLGLIYYNKAANLIQKAKAASTNEETDQLNLKANSLLNKALPYLQKAFDQTPEDMDLKSALLTCYLKLGMDSDYRKLKDS